LKSAPWMLKLAYQSQDEWFCPCINARWVRISTTNWAEHITVSVNPMPNRPPDHVEIYTRMIARHSTTNAIGSLSECYSRSPSGSIIGLCIFLLLSFTFFLLPLHGPLQAHQHSRCDQLDWDPGTRLATIRFIWSIGG
jgi:hypothetical protein